MKFENSHDIDFTMWIIYEQGKRIKILVVFYQSIVEQIPLSSDEFS